MVVLTMERVSVFCFLLLLRCLSGAELQDSNIAGQTEASAEVVNVPEQPQTSTADVQAVLRDLSAKVAVFQFRTEQLEKLNQELNTRLTEVEKQTSGVESLKIQQQDQADKLKELEKQTSDVETLQQGQATELHSLKTWSTMTEDHVDSLIRERAVRRVAFSASLVVSGQGTFGPYNAVRTLVFRRVISNFGDAYNPNTGFFTAPVKGAYHFEVYLHGYPDNSNAVAASLVKNGNRIVSPYARVSGGAVAPSNGATLLLEPGDVVSVLQWGHTRIFDNDNHHTSFSGHLLFVM